VPDFVSTDNHTTYAIVTLEGSDNDLEHATPELRELVENDAVEAYLVGNAAVNYDVEKASAEDLAHVERFTFPIVAILLVLVFGSLVAAGVPLVLGAVTVLVALGFIWLLAQATDVSIFALNIGTMIGLGLAIDFSLIMVSRFREELRSAPLEVALERTLQTSGRSITYSGITLALTMAVLSLFPVMIIRSVAVAIAIVAAVAVITALFLLPTVFVYLHRHLDKWNLRAKIRWLNRPGGQGWHRTIAAVMRRPVAYGSAALFVLFLMALPAIWMKTTGTTVDVLPEETVSRQAVQTVRDDFGAGEPTPLMVVVHSPVVGGLWDPQVQRGLLALHEHLKNDPRVDRVRSIMSIIPNPSPGWAQSLSPAMIQSSPDRTRIARRLSALGGDGATTVLLAYSRSDETSEETQQLLKDIRDDGRTWAPDLAGVEVAVGGAPAQHHDFLEVLYDQFWLLLLLSLLITYIVLMLFFHSLVLPLLAIALNFVSLFAAYGALVFVFQWGAGDAVLGFDSLGAIQGYTPVLLFSVLFGLSTDYQVFLLTRVREHLLRGASYDDAVARGLEQTAGIITAAALIMVVVFGSFAMTGVLVIKEIGFGLAIAVAVDATLVRVVLVPASMKLLGRWAWWFPRSLDRFVPEIDEGEPAPSGAAASASPAAS
jgi:putative drug exporter of the RND superfamily